MVPDTLNTFSCCFSSVRDRLLIRKSLKWVWCVWIFKNTTWCVFSTGNVADSSFWSIVAYFLAHKQHENRDACIFVCVCALICLCVCFNAGCDVIHHVGYLYYISSSVNPPPPSSCLSECFYCMRACKYIFVFTVSGIRLVFKYKATDYFTSTFI